MMNGSTLKTHSENPPNSLPKGAKSRLNDFDAVHSGASNIENTYLMLWGPNSEEQTECFIEKTALNQYQELSLVGVA